MKKEILEILQCPTCQSAAGKLVLDVQKQQNDKVREAIIRCKTCHSSYPVKNGIPRLLVDDKGLEKEIQGNYEFWKRFRQDKTDQWLLNLPEVNDFGNTKKGNKDLKVNVEKIVQSLDPVKGYALDLGAGTCWTSWQIANRGYTTAAVDLAIEKFLGLESGDVFIEHKNIYFYRVQADMGRLPFMDSVFQVVFVSTAIHHSKTPGKVFQEVGRILVPGGKLYTVGEPNRPVWIPFPTLYANLFQKYNRGSELWYEGCYSVPQWKKFCQKGGLTPKFHIPPNAMDILEGKSCISPDHPLWKRMITKLFHRLPMLNRFRNKLFHIGLYVAGVSFILEAKKEVT